MTPQPKTAIIIGAGPAGLTAAYELLMRSDIKPIVLEESSEYVGGIAKTIRYRGNRIDIGGHRFFSKSDTVMRWWLNIMPLEKHTAQTLSYQGKTTPLTAGGTADPETTDDVMLVRRRQSRIYYNGTFFDYPITLSWQTLKNLGFLKLVRIGVTYFWRRVFPRKPEKSLEDFYINRFGDELYKTFFESYTEKVWGVPCSEISPEWGAQRVKGLSVSAVLINAIMKPFRRSSLDQKGTETSLIEWFLYPKLGPGAMWEKVKRLVEEKGGEVRMGEKAVRLETSGATVTKVITRDAAGAEREYAADYVFSTMPVKDLLQAIVDPNKVPVLPISDNLPYRDFVTAGLLLKKTDGPLSSVADNWIYVHDSSVRVGRIQLFHNWSPYLLKDPKNTLWLGLEYFCNEGDELWNAPDSLFLHNAAQELEMLGLGRAEDVIDGVIIHERKTYPSYTGVYERFDEVRKYLDSLTNLFPIGRNGMHRYNNQDHSMLAAITAVDTILANRTDKSNLWNINVEKEYHEEK